MNKPKKIALLLDDSNGYFARFARGVGNYVSCSNWQTRQWMSIGDKGQICRLDKIDWPIDGAIVQRNIAMTGIEDITNLGVPVILAYNSQEPIANFPTINTGDKEIATKIYGYFRDRGYQRFAFCGLANMNWSIRRQKAFEECVRKDGLEIMSYVDETVENVKMVWQWDMTAMIKWLKKLPKPIAMMLCNDDWGIKVLEACKEVGIEVPEEISIVGVDDNNDCRCNLFGMPLSSLSLDSEKSGFETAKLLDDIIDGREQMDNQKIYTPVMSVVTRNSSDILAIENQQLLKALEFIRANAKGMIQIANVVAVTNISRRGLERLFKDVMGRSIYDEIRRIKCNVVEELLLKTDLSMVEIAKTVGFTDHKHLNRVFASQKNMPPSRFRKLNK